MAKLTGFAKNPEAYCGKSISASCRQTGTFAFRPAAAIA